LSDSIRKSHLKYLFLTLLIWNFSCAQETSLIDENIQSGRRMIV
jgi:hypothetical protein